MRKARIPGGPRGIRFLVVTLLVLAWTVLGPLGRHEPAHGADSWAAAQPMGTARALFTASLLPSGKVLVAGGTAGGAALSSTELYDPSANAWLPAAPMTQARSAHTATLLNDGRVLVAGGRDGDTPLNSAEIYDPATNTWTVTRPLNVARSAATATLLHDGRVLVVGGTRVSGPLDSIELYDPVTRTWTPGATAPSPLVGHTATLLASGRVLVAGGRDQSGPRTSAEVYDPAADAWSAAGGMQVPRSDHTATLLTDGRVLVAGGENVAGTLALSEIYDPGTGNWTPAGRMISPRADHVAFRLPSGLVLVAGGIQTKDSATHAVPDAEIFDPASGTWVAAPPMNDARTGAASAMLASGQVMVAGGQNDSGFLKSVDLYPPVAPVPTATATTPASPTATVAAGASPTVTPGTSPTATRTPKPLPTATPGGVHPDFQILAVVLSPPTSKPDWEFVKPPLHRIARNSPVTLSTYVNINALPDVSHFHVVVRVFYGRVMVQRAGFAVHLDGADVGGIWQHSDFTPVQAGTYTVIATATINRTQHVRHMTFTVR